MELNTHILPAVAAIIFDRQGQVLLQKRKDVQQWGIISGHVEFGETVEEAMLREVEEETNVKGEIIRFIGVYSSPASQTYHYEDTTVQYVTAYFEIRLKTLPSAVFSNDETSALRFFPVDNLPSNMALINQYRLSDALDRTGMVFVR